MRCWAWRYYGAGRWQEALNELKTYKRITGRIDQNHVIADCLRALGRPEEAVPLADEVLHDRTAPNEAKAEAVVVAASALADQGRYAEALAFLGRARTREDVWPSPTRCACGTSGATSSAKAGRPRRGGGGVPQDRASRCRRLRRGRAARGAALSDCRLSRSHRLRQ